MEEEIVETETQNLSSKRKLNQEESFSPSSGNEPESKKPKIVQEENEGYNFKREEEFGIKLYFNKSPGFNGILKQRYSDFLVNEVDEQGNICYIKNLTEIPKDVEDPKAFNLNSEESIQCLNKLVGEEKTQEFLNWIKTASEIGEFLFPAISSKEDRTMIHKSVKSISDTLVSSLNDNGLISVKRGKDKRDPIQLKWPKTRGNYLEFLLYKENKDTTEIINLMCKKLKVKQKTFTFAGTKDKRGVTVQRVTAYRIPAEKLVLLNDQIIGAKFANFKYVEKSIKLGDLKGNHFRIVLRHIDADENTIKQAVSQVEKGFINYYGTQRFGSSSVSTYQVGIALLKNDYLTASNLILNPREGDNSDIKKAREYWQTSQNPSESLKKFPKNCFIERNLLKGIEKFGIKQITNAFSFISRQMRLMYVHSFQSFVWNHMVTERLQRFGYEPIVGDLVLLKSQLEEIAEDELNDEVLEEEEEEKSSSILTNHIFEKQVKLRALTKEDIDKHTYSITDIVLPFPGKNVILPKNEMESIYEEFMKNYGITWNTFHEVKTKDFSLPGGYRKVIEKPSNFSYEVMRYNDVNVPLILDDIQVLSKQESPKSLPDGKFLALKLCFTLPSSSYATMCYRELLKKTTSLDDQKKLNENFNTATLNKQ